jgi:DNA-binding PadR family transcriptional regulator
MYLADRPPVPEDATDFDMLRPLTAYGLSEGLDIPPASSYRAVRWMEAAGFIIPLPQALRITAQPARAYRLTQRGREYAAALRAFKQTVEALR